MFSSNVDLITPSALTSIGKKYWLVSTPNGTHSLLAISVIRTLTYRCFRICSTPSLLKSALKDLRNPLLQNGFPQRIITFNINVVLKKNRRKPNIPISTLRKKDFIILLPYLGSESNQFSKCLKSWVNKFYSIVIESQNHLTSPILFALCCAQGRKKKKSQSSSKLFFLTLGESNISLPTKIAWIVPKGRRLFTRQVVGTAMTSTSAKRSADCRIEKWVPIRYMWLVQRGSPIGFFNPAIPTPKSGTFLSANPGPGHDAKTWWPNVVVNGCGRTRVLNRVISN